MAKLNPFADLRARIRDSKSPGELLQIAEELRARTNPAGRESVAAPESDLNCPARRPTSGVAVQRRSRG